jgi:hypothetical protein
MAARKAAGLGASDAHEARRVDRLGRLIGAKATFHGPACLGVYDGRDVIGRVRLGRARGFEALDERGRSLGFFHSVKAAADAVSAAAGAAP